MVRIITSFIQSSFDLRSIAIKFGMKKMLQILLLSFGTALALSLLPVPIYPSQILFLLLFGNIVRRAVSCVRNKSCSVEPKPMDSVPLNISCQCYLLLLLLLLCGFHSFCRIPNRIDIHWNCIVTLVCIRHYSFHSGRLM